MDPSDVQNPRHFCTNITYRKSVTPSFLPLPPLFTTPHDEANPSFFCTSSACVVGSLTCKPQPLPCSVKSLLLRFSSLLSLSLTPEHTRSHPQDSHQLTAQSHSPHFLIRSQLWPPLTSIWNSQNAMKAATNTTTTTTTTTTTKAVQFCD